MPNRLAISGPPRSPNNSKRKAPSRSAKASLARTDSGSVFRRAMTEFLKDVRHRAEPRVAWQIGTLDRLPKAI
jgi:hypothetical protein